MKIIVKAFKSKSGNVCHVCNVIKGPFVLYTTFDKEIIKYLTDDDYVLDKVTVGSERIIKLEGGKR